MYQSRIQNKKGRLDRLQKKRSLELPDPTHDTYFAIVKDMLGNGRVQVFTEEGVLKMARIPGRMRKSRNKTIIEKNDLIMIAGRDFEDKMDIMYKYTHEEIQQLLRDRLIPEKIYKNLTESDLCHTEGAEDTILFCEPVAEEAEADEGSDAESEEEELDIDQI